MIEREQDLLLPRLLVSLISVTLVGLGVMTIVTGHYYGRTTKLGGAEVTLDGPAATAMGYSTVLFALFPLALWFRAARRRAAWVVGCLVAGAAAFYIATRLR